MAERNIKYSELWVIFKSSSQYQDQIRHWLNLEKHLPIYTWEMQVEVLDGAPLEVIKAHAKLLDPRAAQKLGIEVPRQKKTKRKEWQYRALL